MQEDNTQQKYYRFNKIKKICRDEIYFKSTIDPFKLVSILSRIYIKLNIQYIIKKVELQNIPGKIIFTRDVSKFNKCSSRVNSRLFINNMVIIYKTNAESFYKKYYDKKDLVFTDYLELLRKPNQYYIKEISICDNGVRKSYILNTRDKKIHYNNTLISAIDLKRICNKLNDISVLFDDNYYLWFINIIYNEYLKRDVDNNLDRLIMTPPDDYITNPLLINMLKEINNWYDKAGFYPLIIKTMRFGPIHIIEERYGPSAILTVNFLSTTLCYRKTIDALLDDTKYSDILRLISYYVDNYPGGKNFLNRLKSKYLKQVINIE